MSGEGCRLVHPPSAPYILIYTKRLALSICLPSDERNNFAQIERAEKHRLEPMAMQKPRRLNEASERDDVATLRKHERRGRWSLATRSGCNGDGLGGRVEHGAMAMGLEPVWSMLQGYGLGYGLGASGAWC